MIFTLDFVPTKRRPRFGKGRAYDPKENRQEAKAIQQAWREAGGCELHDGPVHIRVEVFRSLPKSRPKRVHSEPDLVKPDADNIGKAVMDALTGLAYTDDSQVVNLQVIKHDRMRGEGEGVSVRLELM